MRSNDAAAWRPRAPPWEYDQGCEAERKSGVVGSVVGKWPYR